MFGKRKARYLGEKEVAVSLDEMIEAGKVPVSRRKNVVTFRDAGRPAGTARHTSIEFKDASQIMLVDEAAFLSSKPARINRAGEAEVLELEAAKEQVVADAALDEAKRLYPAAF